MLSKCIGQPTTSHREATICSLIEDQCKLNPNLIALTFEDESLSFTMLNQHANQVAWFLLELLSQREDPPTERDASCYYVPLNGIRVALYFERSVAFVVTLLAVIKLGGTIVPLDTSMPRER